MSFEGSCIVQKWAHKKIKRNPRLSESDRREWCTTRKQKVVLIILGLARPRAYAADRVGSEFSQVWFVVACATCRKGNVF